MPLNHTHKAAGCHRGGRLSRTDLDRLAARGLKYNQFHTTAICSPTRALTKQKSLGIVPRNTQIAARPPQIPAWDTLPAETRRVYDRYMEVYAAMLAYQDAQFGRLLDELERMEIGDDTLIFFIEGDNGASGESGGLHGTINELNRITAVANDDTEMRWLADHLAVEVLLHQWRGRAATAEEILRASGRQ